MSVESSSVKLLAKKVIYCQVMFLKLSYFEIIGDHGGQEKESENLWGAE